MTDVGFRKSKKSAAIKLFWSLVFFKRVSLLNDNQSKVGKKTIIKICCWLRLKAKIGCCFVVVAVVVVVYFCYLHSSCSCSRLQSTSGCFLPTAPSASTSPRSSFAGFGELGDSLRCRFGRNGPSRPEEPFGEVRRWREGWAIPRRRARWSDRRRSGWTEDSTNSVGDWMLGNWRGSEKNKNKMF